MAGIDKNDPEVKALIEAAVEAAIEPLERKKDELLGEVKKLRKNSTIDPDEHQKLADKVTELEAKITESGKALKSAEKKAEQAEKALQSESGAVQKLLVDNGLTAELVKIGIVKPAQQKAVKAMLSSQVTVKIDGENRIAVVGDKPLGDFIKEWAASDEGKEFVPAAQNTGSGAQGTGTGAGAKTMTRSQHDALSDKEKMAFIKEGGKLTDS